MTLFSTNQNAVIFSFILLLSANVNNILVVSNFILFLLLGCSGPGHNLFFTGAQYIDDQCTRICTCNETGRFACMALCPTTPYRNIECAVPLVPRKTRVPVGPAKYRCHCQQIICEKPRMYFAVISEFVRSFRILYRDKLIVFVREAGLGLTIQCRGKQCFYCQFSPNVSFISFITVRCFF